MGESNHDAPGDRSEALVEKRMTEVAVVFLGVVCLALCSVVCFCDLCMKVKRSGYGIIRLIWKDD